MNKQATFKSTSQSPGFPGYADRSGQQVEIIRELSAEEVDAEVGSMFLIKFADGIEAHAYSDELDNT